MKTKTIVLSITIICFATILKAQDVIVKNDKSEIKSKVIEITDASIKYKKWENVEGPIYNVPKSEVFMIVYANGQRETLGPVNNIISKTPQEKTSDNINKVEEYENNVLRLGTTTNFNLVDLEYDWRHIKIGQKKDFSIGLGGNITYATDLGIYLYATAAQRIHLTEGSKAPLRIWGSAGIAATLDASTGEQLAPGAFLWELGTDIPVSRDGSFGLTAYTPQFHSLFFGIYINF